MPRRDHTYGSLGDCTITFDNLPPEGRIPAPTGSMHLDLDSATIYLKQTGIDVTGWVAVAGGGGGSLPDGDYGDVTVSGGGTLIEINDGVVTLDKLQDIPSGYVLGRTSPGTGDIELIPISSLGGGGTPAGSNLEVQWNDAGAFGADPLFAYDPAADQLWVNRVGIWDGFNNLGTFHTTNNSNLFIGYNAAEGNLTDPSVGAEGAGAGNTALGYYALSALVTDGGTANVAIGAVALGAVTTGYGNFGMGFCAGLGLTTGSSNLFIGSNAGRNLIDGTIVNSVGIGSGALEASGGSYNVAIGNSTMPGVSGTRNIAIGYLGSGNLSVGERNIALGYGVGYSVDAKPSLVSGSQNILLGMFATPTAVDASNEFVIGSTYHTTTDVYIGNGAYNEAPASVTYNATGGWGTDIAGASLNLAGGRGTGTGVGGNINFKVAPAGATSDVRNALVDALTINGNTRVADFAVAPTVAGVPLGGGTIDLVQTTDLVVVSNNVLQDTQLVAAVAAGTYAIEAFIAVNGHVTPQCEVMLVQTGTLDYAISDINAHVTSGTTAYMLYGATLPAGIGLTTTGVVAVNWRATVKLTVGGNLKMQFRQLASNINAVTFKKGSRLQIRRIA